MEIDSHEPDALEGDAFPGIIHAVNVEKGTVTVSYEVDEGAPPDYQEMDYLSKDIAWTKAPEKPELNKVPKLDLINATTTLTIDPAPEAAPTSSPTKDDAAEIFKHPHSKIDAPLLSDAVDYAVEIDSHEPDALEGDAFPGIIHAVNVEKGTVTVSYEVDEGAPPDYQEMDYLSKDIAWIKTP